MPLCKKHFLEFEYGIYNELDIKYFSKLYSITISDSNILRFSVNSSNLEKD